MLARARAHTHTHTHTHIVFYLRGEGEQTREIYPKGEISKLVCLSKRNTRTVTFVRAHVYAESS